MNAHSPNISLLQRLNALPKRLLQLHNSTHVSDFLLHELCTNCFQLSRAAYLVDNPDFNCLQGISGFVASQAYQQDTWQEPEQFINYITHAEYPNRVKQYSRCSVTHASVHDEQTLNSVAHDLSFTHPSFYHFELKHGNHGIFIFEREQQCELPDEYLHNSLYYFSFCPVNAS